MFYDNENKCVVVSKADNATAGEMKAKAISRYGFLKYIIDKYYHLIGKLFTCVFRNFIEGTHNFEFEFPYKQYKNIILTSDNQMFIAYGYEKQKEMLFVHHAEMGDFLHKIPVKYPNFKEVTMIVALPDKPWQVSLIDMDKGNVIDVKNKKFVRSIPQWGGRCSKDGKYGLYAPSRGGLDMLDLRHGTVMK